MTRFAEAVEHVRSRLWHGPVQRALELIGDIVAALDAIAAVASPPGGAAGKVAKLLQFCAALRRYVTGRSEPIIDYAATRHDGGATASTESTVQWLLHRRMGAHHGCAGRCGGLPGSLAWGTTPVSPSCLTATIRTVSHVYSTL
jgi:hypothetical protein